MRRKEECHNNKMVSLLLQIPTGINVCQNMRECEK